ncbi:MAG TPA: hypothetical protein VFK08_07385 [Rhodanobacteraceae bacterium]|nr:hypothetical protein [Rhodanobacteraceae bacterium]
MNAWLPRTRWQWLAVPVGVLALVACLLLGLFRDPRQTLLSYLFAFFFFTGLSVGSLALLMVHALTGGAWGRYIRAPLLAAARVLPLMAVALIPILVCLHNLYIWSQPAALMHDPVLRQQGWYLATAFFVIRSVAYFVLWIGWSFAFTRNMDDPLRAPRWAASGLIVYALTSLTASVDWVVSLTPHWHSSTFGMMVGTGWILVAMALAVAIATRAQDPGDAATSALHDLGGLLMALVLAWAYLAFMQYLTIWIADLPDENSWYIPRTLTSWRYLAWFLIAFHFLIPFVLLLSRGAKRRRVWMRALTAMLVIANLADAFWLVVPSFRAHGFALRWSDLLAPLGIGALWCCVYAGQLRVARAAMPARIENALAMERTDG